MSADIRAEFVAGLRTLADLMDAHPEIPTPSRPTISFYPHDDERAVVALFEGLNLVNREVKINADQRFGFELTGTLGPIRVRVVAEPAKVCTPTGQQVVTTYEYAPNGVSR